ncbi:hypothetical protein SAMN04488030_2243 [Aliiroseovarius halocynthiae]|uniref:Uncharacterized protein n=1 Tax=Aliiroseovarius halocynthiae TaxID=985055 RepID=A0A545SZQ1_9RHOB|nr:hypothetical protein [Aliiroseovarius halocynthiae]TQV70458.1 hypothetical protein FIL88_00720 [Aliiroseovarius halocynthiae]SMR81821.1 hypothetical protein SAMN04488030_2243 [Aliiroseovarius halocynthiae]
MSEQALDLEPGEALIESFSGNLPTYVKEHVMLAALGAVVISGGLMAMGNPYPWTGVVGSVAAIAVRGLYVAKEQLGFTWHLTNRRLIGPDGRTILLSSVDKVNVIFTAAQVVTHSGDKYMLKYQADAKATQTSIDRARGAA